LRKLVAETCARFRAPYLQSKTVRRKPKRRGSTRGTTRAWKKAIVEIRAGETIPIFAGLEGAQ